MVTIGQWPRTRPTLGRSVIAATWCMLGWAAGAGVSLVLLKFPTIAMLVFFGTGLFVAPLLGLTAERLATFLEPTDVITLYTRFRSVALLVLLAFAVPVAASRYVPGVRLPPVADAPGRPTIVFSASGLHGNAEIYLMQGTATALTRLTADPAFDWMPALSPDGAEVAFVSDRDGDEDVYVLPVSDPASIRQLTDEPGRDRHPAWSPDGTMIAFTSERSGNQDVWVMNGDGSNPVDLTARSRADEFEPSWSPDGATIAFSSTRGGSAGIWSMLAAGGRPSRLTGAPLRWATAPAWSEDGSRICITGYTNRNGDSDVYTMRADGSGLLRLTADPSDEWGCHWFGEDRNVWLLSDRPDFGFTFAYFVASTGGEATLFLRA